MSRPSRSVVNGWDLMSLDAAASALDAAVDDLRDLTQRMAEAPMKAGDSKGWVGDSQRGCETRTDSDRTEINKLGADITRAAHSVATPSISIRARVRSSSRSMLKADIEGAAKTLRTLLP